MSMGLSMSKNGTTLHKPRLGQTWIYREVDPDLYPDGVAFLITDTVPFVDPKLIDYQCRCSFLHWLRAGDRTYPMITMQVMASTLILSDNYQYWVTNPDHWSKIRNC